MIFFNQPFTLAKVILMIILIAGIIGLKLTTNENEEGGQ